MGDTSKLYVHRVLNHGDDNWSHGYVIATISDVVAALQEEGVGEVVEATEDDQMYDEWALVPVRWPGRYLVVCIDGEETG